LDRGDYMYFQFLIEDRSGEILIRHIMDKLQNLYDNLEYDCKSFKGLGGLKYSSSVIKTKTNKPIISPRNANT
jgi:hypothetical protein